MENVAIRTLLVFTRTDQDQDQPTNNCNGFALYRETITGMASERTRSHCAPLVSEDKPPSGLGYGIHCCATLDRTHPDVGVG